MSTTTAIPTLDVRPIPHEGRHRLTFNRLAALADGDRLRLVNDHDPVPLRLQLERQSPGQFEFTYLQSGPSLWRLEVRRLAAAGRVGAGSCCSGGACCG